METITKTQQLPNPSETVDQVLPPVSFDVRLGQHIDHIDVDQSAMADDLRSSGATEADIANSPVLITEQAIVGGRPVDVSFDPETRQTDATLLSGEKDVMGNPRVEKQYIDTAHYQRMIHRGETKDSALKVGTRSVDLHQPADDIRADVDDAAASDNLDALLRFGLNHRGHQIKEEHAKTLPAHRRASRLILKTAKGLTRSDMFATSAQEAALAGMKKAGSEYSSVKLKRK